MYLHEILCGRISVVKMACKDVVCCTILDGDEVVNLIKRNYLSKDYDMKEKPQLKKLKPSLTSEDLMAAIYH